MGIARLCARVLEARAVKAETHKERVPLNSCFRVKPCPNGKCLATKHDQTLFGYQTF